MGYSKHSHVPGAKTKKAPRSPAGLPAASKARPRKRRKPSNVIDFYAGVKRLVARGERLINTSGTTERPYSVGDELVEIERLFACMPVETFRTRLVKLAERWDEQRSKLANNQINALGRVWNHVWLNEIGVRIDRLYASLRGLEGTSGYGLTVGPACPVIDLAARRRHAAP